MLTQIINGTILTADGRWLNNGSIILSDDIIAEVRDTSRKVENVDRYIDAGNGFILPGFIDLHTHGASGYDFMDAGREAFECIVATHRRHGTTSMFPTISSASFETMQRAAKVCDEMVNDKKSGVLGLHFEGPYFNHAMAGGQLSENIRRADKGEYEYLIKNYGCIRRWDAAPEIPGALEFGKFASANNLVVGIAHTQADYADVVKARENGYSHATHFYNAMTGIHKEGIYKKTGTVEAIYLFDDITVEVIADGVHVPPEILRLVYRIKGADRTCLVTDALAVTEADDALDSRVVIENGVCKLKDGSAIAGSCSTMDVLVRVCVNKAGIPLADVAVMASETPAKIMGVFDRKGSLSKGKDADIVILNRDLGLSHVIAMGDDVAL